MTTSSENSPHTGRRAFVFYTNWYTDVIDSLTPEQVDEFILIIVRYATFGTLPGASATPVVRTMFGLIRNVIDADLKKYDAITLRNREKAEASAAKTRSKVRQLAMAKVEALEAARTAGAPAADAFGAAVSDAVTDAAVDVFDNQQHRPTAPIHNTQHSTPITQHSTPNTQHPELKKQEEEAPAPFNDIAAYWREHGYKSDPTEFYAYYSRRCWMNNRGLPIRSWQRAAVMWEDKFRRDVLPVRRREAQAEAQMRREAQQVESEQIRRAVRLDREAEEDRRQARALSPQHSKHMFHRAVLLCNGNEDRAIDLMRRVPDDPDLFRRLSEGYIPAATSRQG